jgi:hypothetical protein
MKELQVEGIPQGKEPRHVWDVEEGSKKGSKTIKYIGERETYAEKQKHKDERDIYTYDGVFDTDRTTREVYEKCCREVVTSAVSGINGTIVCYGQTSSGKTYTMFGAGAHISASNGGVMTFFLDDTFALLQDKTVEADFVTRLAYLEIYNERVVDLLVKRSAKSKKEQQQQGWGQRSDANTKGEADLEVFEDRKRGPSVKGLIDVPVCSTGECLAAIERGTANRHVASTAFNQRSSRSHTILRFTIERRSLDDKRNSAKLEAQKRRKSTQRETPMAVHDMGKIMRGWEDEDEGSAGGEGGPSSRRSSSERQGTGHHNPSTPRRRSGGYGQENTSRLGQERWEKQAKLAADGRQMWSTVYLVDLAGSELLRGTAAGKEGGGGGSYDEDHADSRGGAIMDLSRSMSKSNLSQYAQDARDKAEATIRYREGKNINLSLSALTTVVSKLTSGKGGHIPYRDSKLTRLLQSSIGGDAVTSMICCISPAWCNRDMSKSTLRFGLLSRNVRNRLVKRKSKNRVSHNFGTNQSQNFSATVSKGTIGYDSSAATTRSNEMTIAKYQQDVDRLSQQLVGMEAARTATPGNITAATTSEHRRLSKELARMVEEQLVLKNQLQTQEQQRQRQQHEQREQQKLQDQRYQVQQVQQQQLEQQKHYSEAVNKQLQVEQQQRMQLQAQQQAQQQRLQQLEYENQSLQKQQIEQQHKAQLQAATSAAALEQVRQAATDSNNSLQQYHAQKALGIDSNFAGNNAFGSIGSAPAGISMVLQPLHGPTHIGDITAAGTAAILASAAPGSSTQFASAADANQLLPEILKRAEDAMKAVGAPAELLQNFIPQMASEVEHIQARSEIATAGAKAEAALSGLRAMAEQADQQEAQDATDQSEDDGAGRGMHVTRRLSLLGSPRARAGTKRLGSTEAMEAAARAEEQNSLRGVMERQEGKARRQRREERGEEEERRQREAAAESGSEVRQERQNQRYYERKERLRKQELMNSIPALRRTADDDDDDEIVEPSGRPMQGLGRVEEDDASKALRRAQATARHYERMGQDVDDMHGRYDQFVGSGSDEDEGSNLNDDIDVASGYEVGAVESIGRGHVDHGQQAYRGGDEGPPGMRLLQGSEYDSGLPPPPGPIAAAIAERRWRRKRRKPVVKVRKVVDGREVEIVVKEKKATKETILADHYAAHAAKVAWQAAAHAEAVLVQIQTMEQNRFHFQKYLLEQGYAQEMAQKHWDHDQVKREELERVKAEREQLAEKSEEVRQEEQDERVLKEIFARRYGEGTHLGSGYIKAVKTEYTGALGGAAKPAEDEDGYISEETGAQKKRRLMWKALRDEQDMVYYWNTQTNETQYERPEELEREYRRITRQKVRQKRLNKKVTEEKAAIAAIAAEVAIAAGHYAMKVSRVAQLRVYSAEDLEDEKKEREREGYDGEEEAFEHEEEEEEAQLSDGGKPIMEEWEAKYVEGLSITVHDTDAAGKQEAPPIYYKNLRTNATQFERPEGMPAGFIGTWKVVAPKVTTKKRVVRKMKRKEQADQHINKHTPKPVAFSKGKKSGSVLSRIGNDNEKAAEVVKGKGEIPTSDEEEPEQEGMGSPQRSPRKSPKKVAKAVVAGRRMAVRTNDNLVSYEGEEGAGEEEEEEQGSEMKKCDEEEHTGPIDTGPIAQRRGTERRDDGRNDSRGDVAHELEEEMHNLIGENKRVAHELQQREVELQLQVQQIQKWQWKKEKQHWRKEEELFGQINELQEEREDLAQTVYEYEVEAEARKRKFELEKFKVDPMHSVRPKGAEASDSFSGNSNQEQRPRDAQENEDAMEFMRKAQRSGATIAHHGSQRPPEDGRSRGGGVRGRLRQQQQQERARLRSRSPERQSRGEGSKVVAKPEAGSHDEDSVEPDAEKKKGMQHSTSIDAMPYSQQQRLKSQGIGAWQVRALLKYRGRKPTGKGANKKSYLPFEEGDMLTILFDHDEKHWECELAGVPGLVPKSYVTEMFKREAPADEDQLEGTKSALKQTRSQAAWQERKERRREKRGRREKRLEESMSNTSISSNEGRDSRLVPGQDARRLRSPQQPQGRGGRDFMKTDWAREYKERPWGDDEGGGRDHRSQSKPRAVLNVP